MTNVAKTSLFGPRRRTGTVDPRHLLEKSREVTRFLRNSEFPAPRDVSELKIRLAESCQIYYSLAASSRRKHLDDALRSSILKSLFPLRSLIENSIQRNLERIGDQQTLMAYACTKSFFGYTKKQGVSIRFPLMTCVPTSLCGGLCYAHDGRDRGIHIMFRAQLNYYIANKFEQGSRTCRSQIMSMLDRSVDYGIKQSIHDAESARAEGFTRSPRIRFSHIGEMAAVPEFSNSLAAEIKSREPMVQCVMYSRHPDVGKLNSDLFVINFTIDAVSRSRLKFAPSNSRIVSSGWDGETEDLAEITFLEHHVEKVVRKSGSGLVCPVTENHDSESSCDQAKCNRCFEYPERKLLPASRLD